MKEENQSLPTAAGSRPPCKKAIGDAQRFYDALKRITLYDSTTRLRRSSEKDWGLGFEEAIEMAYENIQQEARNAIKGKRRPVLQALPDGGAPQAKEKL